MGSLLAHLIVFQSWHKFVTVQFRDKSVKLWEGVEYILNFHFLLLFPFISSLSPLLRNLPLGLWSYLVAIIRLLRYSLKFGTSKAWLSTYNQIRVTTMAGAPVTMQSVLQFLTKYATPAKAISDKVQQYQIEVPMRLRCFGPASSVRSTNADIPPPPAKKSRRVRLTWF